MMSQEMRDAIDHAKLYTKDKRTGEMIQVLPLAKSPMVEADDSTPNKKNADFLDATLTAMTGLTMEVIVPQDLDREIEKLKKICEEEERRRTEEALKYLPSRLERYPYENLANPRLESKNKSNRRRPIRNKRRRK